jgi:hypothetical protein
MTWERYIQILIQIQVANINKPLDTEHVTRQIWVQTSKEVKIVNKKKYKIYIQSLKAVDINKELFTFNSQVHNCNTRIIHDLHYPQTTIAQFHYISFHYMGAKVFNHLPTKI